MGKTENTMTQIQDLRIGNLVYDSHREGEIQTIESIKQTKFFGAFVGFATIRGNFVEVDSDRINGIPLTEKILLDSGFEIIVLDGKSYFNYNLPKEQLGTVSFTPTFQVEVSISGLFRFAYCLKDIPCETKYVHDLQNAFYMATGKELNIVIK